jgi:hypothetical protein
MSTRASACSAQRACSDEVDAPFAVIAGLDPAIHPFAKMMDPRVKPGNDGGKRGTSVLHPFQRDLL